VAKRIALTRAAQQRLDKLQEQYKPKRPTGPSTSIAIAVGHVAATLCRDDLANAKAAFDAFKWSDSAKLYGDVRRHAEALRTAVPAPPEIDAVLASATFGEAASLLNLQQTEKAASLLSDIDTTALSERQRCSLATALVQTGQASRAQELLASVSRDGQAQPFYIEAQQIVDLVGAGQPPSAPILEAHVFSVLAQHYLKANLLAKAADTASEGLAVAGKNPILRASLLASIMFSLLRTLFDDDTADGGVPVDSRRGLAERIATGFPEVFKAELPDPTRQMLLGVGLNYASSVRERRLLRWLLDNTDAAQRAQAASPDGAHAFTLAGEGRVADAIAVLPRQEHPWRSDLQRCQLIAVAGDAERAANELLILATRWPNRFPIQVALADAFSEANRHHDAAEHAEAAFNLFPTDSMAELLARCLVSSEQGARALAVLIDRPTSEQVAELRAHAADLAHDAMAAAHWREVLRLRPESRAAKMGLALALARAGDAEDAARHARDLINREIDRLSRDELATCGQILSYARFLPGTDAIICRVADALRTRFPEDDIAEFRRLTLVTMLGFPDGVAPIDYVRLAKAGLVESLSLDDAVDLIGKRRDLTMAAHQLYTEGWLSFASFSELTGARTANVLVRSAASAVATRLRAPVQADLSDEPSDLADRTLICTPLELLLLGQCGILEHVSEALRGGRLVTTQAAWESMLEDGYFLEQSAQRDEAARLRSLIARISDGRVLRATEDGTEREVALARGCRYVTTTPSEPDEIDALALLDTLASTGSLSRSDLALAARCFGRKTTSSVVRPIPDEPLFFEAGVLDLYDRAKVLDVVLNALKQVVASLRDLDLLRLQLSDYELTAAAASLQRSVTQRLGTARSEGWFGIIPTPPPPPLPPLRTDVEKERADLLTHSIRQLLPLKHLTLTQKGWIRLTAESFGFDSIGHAEQWRLFAFTPSDGHAFVMRHWMCRDREMSLSRFVRSVAQRARRPFALRTLARLGFADALLPVDIIELADEFGRLDMGRPGEILDGAEAAAGDALVHGVGCRLHLGMAYARAAWFAATSSDSERLRDVPLHLLARLERIDNAHSTRLVEQALGNLFLCALDDRGASFVRQTKETYNLDRFSPAGRLWSILALWQSGNVAREAMTRRALAHAWLVLGDLKGGPTKAAQWAPLGLITDMLVQGAGVNMDIPSPDAVVAVMSANWTERPLTKRAVTFTLGASRVERTAEEMLQAGAAVIDRDGARSSDDGTSMTFDFQPAPEQPVSHVRVPFEAAILRASPAAAALEAIGLSRAIGILDGRLYRALVDFASDPTSDSRRRALASAACGSPFRWVADDPRFLLRLGDYASSSQHDFPADLDELREMLSEPPTMLTGDPVGVPERELPLELARRLEGGIWSARHDKAELVHLASRFPGRLPAEAARSLIGNAEPDELRSIAEVLTSSAQRSLGELAIATALAAHALFGKHASEDPSLREVLVGGLSAMLESESKAPEACCLASLEPAILDRVGRVVARLSLVPMPVADHAWLTHRLYEWWVRLASFEDMQRAVRADCPQSWHEVRTELILNVLLDVLEVQLVALRQTPQPIAGLAPRLLDLASQHLASPFEPAPRPPSWHYWDRPQGIGWLASSIALWLDPTSFFKLQPEIRLAGLDRLPRTEAAARKNGVSFASFVPAMTRYMSKLTEAEVAAVREWLSVAEPSVLLDLWRADLLTGFLAAHGDPTDAAQLRALAMRESVAKARVELLVAYMEAVASSQPESLRETVFELADAIAGVDGPDSIDRAIALALERPRGDLVRALLTSLDEVAAGSAHLGEAHLARAVRAALNAKPLQGPPTG
jgi:tetratricopeptide (TPR) repeat protein